MYSDGNYSNVVFTDIDTVKDWIVADTECLKQDDPSTEDYEYTIKIAWMTQEEIDNLPDDE